MTNISAACLLIFSYLYTLELINHYVHRYSGIDGSYFLHGRHETSPGRRREGKSPCNTHIDES